uniref:Uncharacterized protein n=1 Tax=Anguilla anguilla TaxID=7936 RepID=A0A0E9V024_ANGAN
MLKRKKQVVNILVYYTHGVLSL